MDSLETAVWKWLEAWRTAAFLAAGAVLVLPTLFGGLAAMTGAEPPGCMAGLLVATGIGVGLVGLVGFDPLLADAAPRLSLAGTLLAGLAGLAALGTFLAVLAGAVRPAVWTPVGPLSAAMLLGTAVGFLLFAVGCLRSGVPSRGVGLVLLGPPVVLVAILATKAGPVEGTSPTVGALLAGSHAAVGVVLRAESAPADRTEPGSEPTAE